MYERERQRYEGDDGKHPPSCNCAACTDRRLGRETCDRCHRPVAGRCNACSLKLCGSHTVEHAISGHSTKLRIGRACRACEGRGEIYSRWTDPDEDRTHIIRCPVCFGSRWLFDNGRSAKEREIERHRKRKREQDEAIEQLYPPGGEPPHAVPPATTPDNAPGEPKQNEVLEQTHPHGGKPPHTEPPATTPDDAPGEPESPCLCSHPKSDHQGQGGHCWKCRCPNYSPIQQGKPGELHWEENIPDLGAYQRRVTYQRRVRREAGQPASLRVARYALVGLIAATVLSIGAAVLVPNAGIWDRIGALGGGVWGPLGEQTPTPLPPSTEAPPVAPAVAPPTSTPTPTPQPTPIPTATLVPLPPPHPRPHPLPRPRLRPLPQPRQPLCHLPRRPPPPPPRLRQQQPNSSRRPQTPAGKWTRRLLRDGPSATSRRAWKPSQRH